MEEKNTHINDLGGIIPPHSLGVNPFEVPSNFFEKQKEEILNQIQLEKSNVFDSFSSNSVPDNYFQSLENNILNRINEIKLKEQVNSEGDGFAVPVDYFSDLSHRIQDRVNEENLESIATTDGFAVPDVYFTSLESAIQSKIAEQNIRDYADQDGFVAPTSYFEDLENKILLRVKQIDEPAKVDTPVVSLSKWRTNWSKYSAAAVILLIGIGTYLSFSDNPSEQVEIATTVDLQKISDAELVNYLAQESNSQELIQLTQLIDAKPSELIEQLESDINDEDIEEYLNYML